MRQTRQSRTLQMSEQHQRLRMMVMMTMKGRWDARARDIAPLLTWQSLGPMHGDLALCHEPALP